MMAVIRIGERAKLEVQGPISLGGVGNIKMESQHGIYKIRLPLVKEKIYIHYTSFYVTLDRMIK